jgi:hypothetical protein
MNRFLEKILGPRVPAGTPAEERVQYRLPTVLFAAAALLLLVSIFLPYWKMTLEAPQYPKGLSVLTYVNRLEGDVREIDGLNHYIGMRPLGEAAQLERSLSIAAITVLSLLILSATFIHTRYVTLLAVPGVVYPFIFLGDMYFWMRNFGLNLDPAAPLSSAIKPFVPPILGVGKVAQFRTVAVVQSGFYLALTASLLILVGLYYHRRAYKPLVDAAQGS